MRRAWLVLVVAGCGLAPVGDQSLCGSGTHLEGAQCFTDTVGLACGTGTIEQAGVCVPALSCGGGSAQQGTECVRVGTITCGSGTMFNGSQCVAAGSISCGAGTMLQGSTCVPINSGNGWYEVRVGATEVLADGFSKIPVLAIGRLPSGEPATDAVVLSLSRSTAGSILVPGLTLGRLGTSTWFIPCSSVSNPLCAGPAKIDLRLSSNPQQVVAESQIFNLVTATGVGSTAPCDPYANALFFDGESYIFTGTQLITEARFSSASTASVPSVELRIEPTLSTQGSWWNASFAAPPAAGPLTVQVYPAAERYPFQRMGAAGLDVSGNGSGCN